MVKAKVVFFSEKKQMNKNLVKKKMNSLRDRNNKLCVSDKLISNFSIGILSRYN